MRLRYWFLLGVGLIAVIVGASLFGYGTWYNSAHYVSTGNAQVVAELIQVGSLNAGRIVALDVDVGSPVVEGQVIATLDIPAVISRSDITDTAKIGFRDVQDQLVEVVSPRAGVISARWANEDDVVPAGQVIVTVMDPKQIWVVANIKEGDVPRVRPGQRVEVDVDSLGRKLEGRVDTVSPVTAALSTLQPMRSSTSDFSSLPQVVPIKIILGQDQISLIPGSSAKIKIRVR